MFKAGTAAHTNTFGLGDTGRYRTNVWDYAGVNSLRAGRELAIHPTVKPVALVADAIRDCSRRDEIVLDPFGGSGSTLIATEKTGRRARLIEFDPAYCDRIVRRFELATGKQARLRATGRPFEIVAEERASNSPSRKAKHDPSPENTPRPSLRRRIRQNGHAAATDLRFRGFGLLGRRRRASLFRGVV